MSSEYGVRPPAHRLPAATQLGVVRLQVGDLARSLGYYEGVLGLATIAREGARAVLGTTDGATPIVELHERAGARPVPRGGRLGLYHFAILLPDRPALGRFLGHLAHAGVRVGMSDHFVSEALYLWDPDGLGIEVYADRPRAAWRVAPDGQLAMSSEPLDAQDVLSAGAGEAWSGMPPGTVLGHVHLHVGDLEAAEAFYHRGIGFDKVVWGYPGALFLSAGGYHHHLGTNTWAQGAASAGDDEARLLEWEVVLPSPDDVAALHAHLSAAVPAARLDSGTEGFTAADPWGTVVRVRVGA